MSTYARWWVPCSVNLRCLCAGLLTLSSTEGWNERHALLLGSTVLEGLSPFAAIDFQRAREVFAPLPLDRTDGSTQPAVLYLHNLQLFNLPQRLAVGDGQPAGGVRPGALSALLWISKPRNGASDGELYVLDSVTASVSCTEVAFLRSLFQRLQLNAVESESSDMVVEFMVPCPSS